jgi:hypothetical protein
LMFVTVILPLLGTFIDGLVDKMLRH